MYQIRKRIVALVLVLATALSMLSPAFAEKVTAKVTKDGVRIRAKASQDSEVYQQANKGDKLTVLKAADANGWVKVEFVFNETGDTMKGYVAADYLKMPSSTKTKDTATKTTETKQEETKPAETKQEETKPADTQKEETKPAETQKEETPAATEQTSEEKKEEKPAKDEDDHIEAVISEDVSYTATVTENGVRIREEPNTDAEILTTLPEESIVIVYPGEDEEGWMKVKYYDADGKKYKGYMSGEYLDINSIGSGDCAVTAAIIREEAKNTAPIDGVVPAGGKVDIFASSDGWYKIEYMDKSGWVSADTITTESDAQCQGYAKVTADGLNLRAGATRGSAVLTKISKGAVLMITGSKKGGKWLACTYNGYSGYIRSSYAKLYDTCPDGGYVQVTATSLSLRSGAGSEFTRLATIPQGKVLKLEGAVGSWYQVTYKKFTGYISGAFASPTTKDGFQAYPDYAEITASALTLRSDASTDSEAMASIPKGTILAISGLANGWYRVNYGGQVGYIDSGYAERSTAARAAAAAEAAARAAESSSSGGSSSSGSSSSSSGSSSSGGGSGSSGSILSYASQFVGNPYSWGGTSLTRGADCSGFVKSVLGHFGISVPHSSSAIRSYGRGVSTSDMRPGDIVCYSGHVGIYAGNGKLLSALGKKYGITYCSVNYKKIQSVRRFG